MVRPMNDVRTPGWKAILAVTVGAGALLWHVLACTESPMAFSPGGKDLAFVTMTPYDLENLHLAGKHVYRLCVRPGDGRVRVVAETRRFMLTAPTYSPDGKCLAYLRIPLLTDKATKKLRGQAEARAKMLGDLPRVEPLDMPAPKAPDANQPKTKDLVLPPFGKTLEFCKGVFAGGVAPVELVIRDALATDVVLATTTIDLPVFDFANDKPGESLAYLYVLARPQYSPDGQWVYFCAGKVVVAVNPKTGGQKILAAPATVAMLSPDGKMLAALHDKTVLFVATDGQRTTAVRWEKDLSASGIVWTDNQTLALLSPDDNQVRLHRLRTDGQLVRSTTLPSPKVTADLSTGELAIAPDGKHMVVAYGKEVQFLDANGKVLRRWQSDKEMLSQPTFAPDGKRVAFKRFAGTDKHSTVSQIVLFSPEGKRLSAEALPPPPASRPAKAK